MNFKPLHMTDPLLFVFQTKVSVLDSAGPKYFVLTFVLCGSIAGVVLAVVALYIVRRHSLSKDKLKQLASTSHDGNEASKDYQVGHMNLYQLSAVVSALHFPSIYH